MARDRLAKLTQQTTVSAYNGEFLKTVLTIPGITEQEKLDKYA